MRIAILGATGNVGTRLSKLALTNGDDVIVYARNTTSVLPADRFTVIQGELNDTARLTSALTGTQSVVVLLAAGFSDTTLLQRSVPLIIKAVNELPVDSRPQIVFTSVFGADATLPRASAFAKLVYRTALKKFLADRTKALELLKASGLDYITVYPVNLSPKGQAVSPEIVDLKDLSRINGMPVLNMDSAAAGILNVAARQAASGSAFVLTAPGTWK